MGFFDIVFSLHGFSLNLWNANESWDNYNKYYFIGQNNNRPCIDHGHCIENNWQECLHFITTNVKPRTKNFAFIFPLSKLSTDYGDILVKGSKYLISPGKNAEIRFQ